MESKVAQLLLELNHKFYQTFADEFSATRQRIQSGVNRVLGTLPPDANLLDIGCGNGALAQALEENGHLGAYTGLDLSDQLVQIARGLNLPKAEFFVGDIAKPDWHHQLPNASYDYVLCFAVMHHIPGQDLRHSFLEIVRGLLASKGRFIHSNWQFLESPRLRARIQDWELVGLTTEEVDEHDYLLDWRRGGKGLRYVHHYTSAELHALAGKTGFKVNGLFTSDGETDNLGLYQIWEVKG